MRRSNCVTDRAFSPDDLGFENKSTPQSGKLSEKFER